MKTAIITFLLLPLFLFSQITIKDTIPVKEIVKFNSRYKDFVVIQDKLYCLTKGDSLITWNLKNDKVTNVQKGITGIAKNCKGSLLLTTSNGRIKGNGIKVNMNITGTVYRLLTDIDDKPVVIAVAYIIMDIAIFLQKVRHTIWQWEG